MLVVLVVVFLLATIVGVAGYRSSMGDLAQGKSSVKQKANYAAGAAVQYALRRLAEVPQWNPSKDDLTRATLDENGRLYFSVRVLDNRSGSTAVKSPEGTDVAPGEAYIRALGEVQIESGRGAHSIDSSKAVLAVPGSSTFAVGLMVDSGLKVLDGSVVDGYHTGLAAKSPDYKVRQYSPYTRWNSHLPNGHVVLCSTADQLQVRDSTINGESRHLKGASAPKLEGSYRVRLTENNNRLHLPQHFPPYSPSLCTEDIVVKSGERRLLAPGAYRSLKVLPGGAVYLDLKVGEFNQYFFKESVELDGADVALARYSLKERVQIYIGRSLVAKKSWINSEGLPAQVAIFFVGDGGRSTRSTMSLSNFSQVWAVVSGARTDVEISDASHLFGALRCSTASISQRSAVHYDVALRDLPLVGLTQWSHLELGDILSPSISQEVQALNAAPVPLPVPAPVSPTVPVVPVVARVSEPTPPPVRSDATGVDPLATTVGTPPAAVAPLVISSAGLVAPGYLVNPDNFAGIFDPPPPDGGTPDPIDGVPGIAPVAGAVTNELVRVPSKKGLEKLILPVIGDSQKAPVTYQSYTY